MTAERQAAYLAAYDLWEAVQTEQHASAAAEITQAARVAEREQWPEVQFVLAGAQVVHSLTRAEDPVAAVDGADALVARAEGLEAPALFAVALALRAITASVTGDTAALMADAGRAVALLDDPTQPALDRCTGYVTAGAAFNTLQLWELVDELYTRATELEPDCPVPAQAAALAVNRVLTRLEWALTLIELGEEKEAQDRLVEVATAVGSAEKCDRLPPLWLADIEACAVVVELLRGRPSAAVRAKAADLHDVLAAGDDIEALPLLDAAAALALWRAGHLQEAAEAVDRVTPLGSASSGSRSFPAWVRAEILAGAEPSEGIRAQRAHTQLVSRLRWESRRAVLAAARAQVAAERHKGERDRLAHAVNTDPLTGLSNRRPFDAWLNERTLTASLPTALLLVDVDGFKVINDTCGHDVGDRVLRRFGELLLGCVRPGDMAVRHGGDEFAVVLQGEHLTEEAAVRRAEQFRLAVAAEPWSALSADLRVTATIGVAIATTSARDSLRSAGSVQEALYRAADGALYAAKRTGSGLEVATVGVDRATPP